MISPAPPANISSRFSRPCFPRPAPSSATAIRVLTALFSGSIDAAFSNCCSASSRLAVYHIGVPEQGQRLCIRPRFVGERLQIIDRPSGTVLLQCRARDKSRRLGVTGNPAEIFSQHSLSRLCLPEREFGRTLHIISIGEGGKGSGNGGKIFDPPRRSSVA